MDAITQRERGVMSAKSVELHLLVRALRYMTSDSRPTGGSRDERLAMNGGEICRMLIARRTTQVICCGGSLNITRVMWILEKHPANFSAMHLPLQQTVELNYD